VAAGVALGLVVAFWTTRFTQGLLFQVRAADPLVLAAIGGGLLLAALAACLVPAARAAGVEPARLLRQD
jgi:putative ABC transport system permease protein